MGKPAFPNLLFTTRTESVTSHMEHVGMECVQSEPSPGKAVGGDPGGAAPLREGLRHRYGGIWGGSATKVQLLVLTSLIFLPEFS